ncbi:MAG: LysR family transcriptional regulator [Rhodospirillales bacterium]|jgi:DNA-binding transcriptional LysR family regulator|nr:LysR family transcriptional regulator [Rhodospirillales bacterium]
MDDLSALTIFARIAERQSFSAAARDLGLSKSAVSKKLAALESRLGARLLNRTTRRLSLTEAGAEFFERAQRILAELDEAEQAVTRLQVEPRGNLRVNAPMSFGILHMAPALADFMADHDELTVTLDLNDRLVDLVEEGYDVAVRIARMTDSSLIARKLAPARLGVCASPDYWRKHGVPAHPRDLAGHNCLFYTYLAAQDQWAFRGPDGPFNVRVRGNLRANSGEALRAAAVAGLGIYFGPTFIVGDELRAGRLTTVLDEFVDPDLSIYAVYPHRQLVPAKVRVFVDFLAERFGAEPYWDKD